MKRFSNDLLNELSNEYANKWVKAEALDWRSLRRAYRSGFLTAAKILNGEIRESGESFCAYCKKNPVHENYWLCKECIDAYNLEKQKDLERT